MQTQDGRRRRATHFALLAVFPLMLAGCSDDSPPPATFENPPTSSEAASTPSAENMGQPTPSAAYAAAIADGKITKDEYVAGFKRYQACLAKAGYVLKEPVMDGSLFSFLVPDAAVSSGADDRCYKSEYQQIDAIWQGQNQTDFSVQIEADLDCLHILGVDPGFAVPDGASDKETSDKLDAQIERVPGGWVTCNPG